MSGGALLIMLAVAALASYAIYAEREAQSSQLANYLIVGGGVIFPTLVLSGLLVYGLWMLPDFLARPAQGALKIEVTGEQWWWRVRYLREDLPPIELANEIHLPVGMAVDLRLRSADVIHSFWIPSLAGKVDMIPGHETRLTLEPTRVGTYRGVCAEYCGTSHALMAFPVVVSSQTEFSRWLEAQGRSAQAPRSRGQTLFSQVGCGACHTVRGDMTRGVIGPDLTHVGSRMTIGAGTVPRNRAHFRRFVSRAHDVKPEARMPAFDMLGQAELDDLASYLESLK